VDLQENPQVQQRISKFKRELELRWPTNPLTGSGAVFLWGARQSGKTTYIRDRFPKAQRYDLLDSALSAELSVRPHLLREWTLASRPELVVIDEVQKIPALLDEIHWLLENSPTRFLLCGSSARKLRRGGRNLLGGRSLDYFLFPLTTQEIGTPDLQRLLRNGGLPVHYLTQDAQPLLRAYVDSYLKQEIIDEAATRNVPAFSRFLTVAAHANGQQINYANVARESGVSASTVRSYFQILEDTLIGFTLEPWRKRSKRRLVETAKFYFFDVGVANQLHPEAKLPSEGTDRFGQAFEQFLLNEVRAFLAYRQMPRRLSYWRTSSGFEVDLIVGEMEAALEFKATREIRGGDLKGLRALREEQGPHRSIVVSRVEQARRTEDGIEILPWLEFCHELWAGRIVRDDTAPPTAPH
jgi:predicted AAA+ superfamily ATPase